MTNEQFVSRILSTVGGITKDDHLSKRHILAIGKSSAEFYMAQKLGENSLYKDESLFRTISCFELKREQGYGCGISAFQRCDKLMKSKKKLPELIYGNLGNSIISVTSIDGNIKFYPVLASQYVNNAKRPYAKYTSQYYYYEQDGYLYIPDSDIEVVRVVLITLDTDTVDELTDSDDSSSSECTSAWDNEFIYPTKMLKYIIQDTLTEIANIRKSIVIDENPNLTVNQKDATT